MSQRKLNPDELQKVMCGRHDIKLMCNWDETDRGREYWYGVAKQLDAMALHATTDGKPYVDPEPPIPDGYRKAVAGDEGRSGCKFWSVGGIWKQRCFVGREFEDGTHYIVPIDRTPTDEDAKSRPEVMVRDHDGQLWEKRTLVAVASSSSWPFVTKKDGCVQSWQQCRHLYPGE